MSACPSCAIDLAPRRDLPAFTVEVLRERARLALTDPEGERDAVAPLGGVRARQILLHLAEPEPRERRFWVTDSGSNRDEREILERLGCDLSRDRGMVRCPGPLHPHGDRHRSLSWRWDGRKALLRCHVGCSFDSIRKAAAL